MFLNRLIPMHFGGHCYLVRKCVTGDKDGGVEGQRVGDIYIQDRTADYSLIVEILAVGLNVGRRCSKKHALIHSRARHLVFRAEVGDRLFCDENKREGVLEATWMSNSASPVDYFIEESVPIARVHM